jgi:3-oxoacyl-[acyl-carrier-protein] synthase-3
MHVALGTQGADYDAMIFRGAGSVHPITAEPFPDELRFLQTDGQRVLNFAVRTVTTRLKQELALGGAEMDNIALVIPQQSNVNFMQWLCKKLGFPTERVFVNVDRYANTSSASVAIALCEAFEQGRINDGDDVLLLSFGAGLNWASVLVRCGVREGEGEVSQEPATILAGVEQMLRRARATAQAGVSNLTSAVSVALLPFFTRTGKK